ncbi:tRNA (guanosine(46)-N7)-methyltransferase TrmB [Aquibacillus sp. 3ASR75-11]|uniref:tRNA (guanine-N(7)-)-methyltransferase n=1 Tax=Terrihalobacillus insolitus TaxID=2950438 RepID=A0A9X4AN36_9BACI|nr:tRNA (guanosine(46)-N7)-methyltransferase TrmB [Terrihalobacillus insolitus]MDC3415085.1 tRNA (guanosine(46)-N7)-methyltransferase TrmB [Terrihalobacillus insolitus]MDC3426082.1 tRNA (guanosine(46)-N7)-methyltransferase TrmB [Terrihalobacillus insolitus]
MRTRNKPWADDFLKEQKEVVVHHPFHHKNKWKDVFGNDHPIHIEIGSGKGQFIAGMAKQHSDINFVGIEMAKSIIITAVQKVLETEQKNVRLINENAKDVRDIFGENEVDKIYLNFSDPWPKSRHEKRRLTYPAFLEQYKNILKKNGEIVLKTDNRKLFEYSLVRFSKFGMMLEEVALDLHDLHDPENVMTEYEQRFSNKGQPIYRCRARSRFS